MVGHLSDNFDLTQRDLADLNSKMNLLMTNLLRENYSNLPKKWLVSLCIQMFSSIVMVFKTIQIKVC